MSDNKTMIRFYSLIFIISALFTYIVDLNDHFHFFKLNTPYISNSFYFAILSGILTGVIVALAAEIRQYLLHKRQSRHSLYTIASDLYALISVQKASIKYYINNPYSTIPENIGGDYAQQPILSRISQIPAIDYSTFSKKDTIRLALGSFARKIAMIEQATRNLINLQIAHNQTQISFLESNDTQSKVSAASALMLNALYEEYNALNDCLIELASFGSVFEKYDSESFKWAQGKKTIDDMSKHIELNVHYDPSQEKR